MRKIMLGCKRTVRIEQPVCKAQAGAEFYFHYIGPFGAEKNDKYEVTENQSPIISAGPLEERR